MSLPSFSRNAAPIAFMALVGTILVAVVIAAGGGNPLNALQALISGSVRGSYSQAETLIRMSPLLLTGLGVALAFRAGVWNIGAEGQLTIGALAVAAIAPVVGHLPAPIAILSACVSAALAGGLWAFIAAFLRTRRNVQEVISTIMLNFLSLQIVSWAVHGPLRESTGQFPYSNELPQSMLLPVLLPPTRLHLGVILSLLVAVAIWIILFRTIWGFSIRASGASQEAVRHAGINPEVSIWSAMFASGALAGLAGAFELMGISRILFENFSPGYGYTAIAVALLGKLHPLGIVLSALLFGGLQAGAGAMQRDAGVNQVVVYVAQGIIIIAVALQASATIRKRAVLQARAAEEV